MKGSFDNMTTETTRQALTPETRAALHAALDTTVDVSSTPFGDKSRVLV